MGSVLITGASGFLGSAVVDRMLKAGHAVIGLDPIAGQPAGCRAVLDDLSDASRLEDMLLSERVTHVVHCGGVSGPMVFADDPMRVIDVNVGGSVNLLRASLRAQVSTFVYCSSVSAVGDYYESEPIGDDYPLRPTTTYGASKAAMDMVLRGLWRRVPLDLCSLRFTGIYGPGRKTSYVVNDIVAAALMGKAATVEPCSDWPYVFVDDAADAVVAACFSTQRRQLHYFIAYPEQVSLDDLARAASGGQPVTLNVRRDRAPARRGPVDITAAQRDFGFMPKVDHREGVRRMLEAAREK